MISLLQLEGAEIIDDYKAQLFNQEPLLRETAGYLIYNLNKIELINSIKRIPKEISKEIQNTIEKSKEDKNYLLYYKTLILKQIPVFAQIKSTVLSQMAGFLNIKHLAKQTNLCNNKDLAIPVFIVIDGQIGAKGDENKSIVFSDFDIIDCEFLKLRYTNGFMLTAISDSDIYCIDRGRFNELLFDYPEILTAIIHYHVH
jgi:hypothetical protein